MSDLISILLVDDEPMLVEALKLSLELEDRFKILTANGGDEALKIVSNTENQIQFVLSDVRMPEGDGIELLEKIKSDIKDPPPVLLYSGFSRITEEEVIAKGALGLIKKPVNFDKLISIINASTNA